MSKILYFDLIGGASGDMLLSALINLGFKRSSLRNLVKNLKLRGAGFKFKEVFVGHIKTNKIIFNFPPKMNLSFLEIRTLITLTKLNKKIKEKILKTYSRLKEIEEKVHGHKSRDFRFSHLGKPDALIEIASFWLALEELEIKECFCSTFPLSNPAPATLELLKDKKVRFTGSDYESITPTAGVLLKDFPQKELDFTLKKVGYGAGDFIKTEKEDFLRIIMGEKDDTVKEKIIKIEVNLDDINPQVFDYLLELLFKEGALDVYITQVIMKKSRPSFLLSVLTDRINLDKMKEIIFKHTTTFGIRYSEFNRDRLNYKFILKDTPLGKIRFRQGFLKGSLIKESPEYEDCKKIASKHNIPLVEVYTQLGLNPKIKRRD
ncbi:MAG TPA: LarC family nickel insertion protein [Candidatus Omnitrophica bacterium]|nr:LarC family nickel insertion protein [Candidatus Omnitrophota bacterium]